MLWFVCGGNSVCCVFVVFFGLLGCCFDVGLGCCGFVVVLVFGACDAC